MSIGAHPMSGMVNHTGRLINNREGVAEFEFLTGRLHDANTPSLVLENSFQIGFPY